MHHFFLERHLLQSPSKFLVVRKREGLASTRLLHELARSVGLEKNPGRKHLRAATTRRPAEGPLTAKWQDARKPSPQGERGQRNPARRGDRGQKTDKGATTGRQKPPMVNPKARNNPKKPKRRQGSGGPPASRTDRKSRSRSGSQAAGGARRADQKRRQRRNRRSRRRGT